MATVTVTATHLVLHRTVHLPISEVQLSTTTSSGPGGQHANRTQSKVIGRIDLTTISGLGPVLRQRAIDALGPVVEASSQAQRSQVQNKAAVLQLGEPPGQPRPRPRAESTPSSADPR